MVTMTFQDFDKFDRKPFAERLTKVVTTFYPFYSEAFVLSLNAKFGSGKTTFLKMWQSYLQAEHKIEVLYINAWATDYDDAPILPITSALLDHVAPTGASKDLKKSLRQVLGTLALTGINVS